VNRIRKFREQKQLSQRALAKILGTSQQQIQRYEVGASPVRLDFAIRLSKALDVEAVQLFPEIKRPLAKLRNSKNEPNEEDMDEALRAGGVEADPTVWTAKMVFRGGVERKYRISVSDKTRLENILREWHEELPEPPGGPFFYFRSTKCCALANLDHLIACHILFDAPFEEREIEEPYGKVDVWLLSRTEPLSFEIDPNDQQDLDAEEIENQSGFAANFLMGLDQFGYYRSFAEFRDTDGETAYFRTGDIMLVEAALSAVYPDLVTDEDDENQTVPSQNDREPRAKH
jgi:transcriptional regulator with XRE-family HTH domain